MPRLGTCQSVEDVCNVVHDEIVGSLDAGTGGKVERYLEMACEIWDLWQNWQLDGMGQ